ncbi:MULTISPECIES: GGDEF domain-containing protein [unclassified Shinella]|jgi:diguanylate cyclase (GGDEF)-like protein|uniref:GGDEF domain-containing protein n=1 Tax=unclassified Shinella TaxID=2643062 RepID=UPI0003C54D4D|nr:MULTISPECIES: GGDEF domain-containing protein [unclassified Shinella]EYR82371.1 putative diguanylate cyclase [Shinella sp. DD12]MCO5152507.1 GGDEF domain-containing protein [Shinella sp.]MDC7261800.1 GGDEF domain-containing protein [Shinella sp. HY16]MDC7268695.1 GGDEF domain-containing protein [Shinella sp. YZ44]MDG4675797.1 GGDEF domain-containing protein [Shinella sp. 838]
MGIENLILLLIEAGFYFVFMVGLLHLRHQLGIGVFIAALGVMHFLETYLAAVFYIELPFGVISPGSSVLFSGKLMMILLLYVKEDAAVVRAPIYGLLAGNFLTVGLSFFLRHHQTIGVVPGRIADLAFIDEMGWLMLWGTTLLYLDSLAIILLYERLGRVFKKNTALRFFVSGIVVLTFDQIGFFAALHFLNGAPTEVFWGGWIAKMLAASAYAVLITVYLHYSRISAIPVSPRPISDIFADLTFRERYEDLLDRSGRDALTGVYDRSRLEFEAPRMLSAMLAEGKPMALMIIDADHFKDVNDRFGHLAGDGVLKDIAASLQRALRTSDRLFRFGGEEFVVICEDISPAVGTERAQMLRQAVEAEIRRPDGVPVTVSIGIANSYSDGTTLNALLSAADARLYAAKNGGRNRVISSESV